MRQDSRSRARAEPLPDFTVAIVGRPNVGKSTLFNRLAGRRTALVDDRPGMTRDRREGAGRLGDLRFRLVDTAGYEDAHDASLQARMREQTERAVTDAHLVMMLTDARAGITALDAAFATRLRKSAASVILVANKCEGRTPGLYEAFDLGLGDPVPLSAEHGEGLGDLYDVLAAAMTRCGAGSNGMITPHRYGETEADNDKHNDADADKAENADAHADNDADNDADTDNDAHAAPVRLAVIGRPNVGKSTLINALLGEDRLLSGPEAGITRDSVAVDWRWKGRLLRLIDTAGMRRKARVTARVERLSVADARRAVDFAHVAILVLDATVMLEKQDLTIARQVLDEGRALIIAANKWDLVTDASASMAQLNDRLATSLPQAKGLPVVGISALHRRKLDRLLESTLRLYDVWNRRAPTSALNRWLEDRLQTHPPPLVAGRRAKIRYITQAGVRPPTFALFMSRAGALPDAYLRYLENHLRADFGFPGVPLRLAVRKGKNPYDSKP